MDFRFTPGVVMYLSRPWHLAGGFRYQTMVGTAEKSPVVHTAGSANQWIVGLGAAFSWRSWSRA